MAKRNRIPSFATFTADERTHLENILTRAEGMYKRAGLPFGHEERSSLRMDLSATHARVPLDLERLAGFDDFDFAHDVSGINRHLDRKTGDLGGCFLPRCARPEAPSTGPDWSEIAASAGLEVG